ncbi:type II toxin-antitoxin system HigB family toxin [Dyadobacter sandarakinus]|uniref:Type II toxin-antitoxin system HigB family toxin n=1 Tax=Dyadobacter sandarakinus TaxID=2747268 RepID=A0ABX7IAT4_9BACT|nr:type II toxin-antitoxin system HigB family toxin [Dyadobacter sandarakinus]QRR02238.1 type II toxin-antitoxin system HigB family toxin [Dyadobacter sandarakinus]
MRIFTRGTLRSFWNDHPDARPALEFWYDSVEKNRFDGPNGVIKFFKNADTVGNGRIVFNIAHNKYRLVAKFEYERQLVFVRFIGNHAAYDSITNIKEL